MSKLISVKEWKKMQHYKERDPKWIKLYRDLLDDYQYGQLPDVAKGHLIGIFLLAAKLNNEIPDDSVWIAQRIGAKEEVDLDLLVNAGFLARNNGSINPLASCYQPAIAEAEAEAEKSKKKGTPKKFIKPTVEQLKEYSVSIGYDNLDCQYFIDKYDGIGWMVGKNKMKDWKAVVRTWKGNGFEKSGFGTPKKDHTAFQSSAPRKVQ